MTGLPLQSLKVDDDQPYHQPLRLTAVIHAPVDRVTEILRKHGDVRTLLDNGWIGDLTVVDPEQDNAVFQYAGDLEWATEAEVEVEAEATPEPETEPAPVPQTADDD